MIRRDNSYLSNISLPQKRLDQLLQSSNALRERIRGYSTEKKVGNPRFYRQGSYIYRTLIRPLSEDYDLDDWVYLDLAEFTSTPSPATIHDWIHTAVEDYTQKPPADKEACVRANFKDGFHVDLPACNAIKNTREGSEEYYLARKTKGWELSNPRAMTAWFTNMVGIHPEQLRRLVKYAKSWADYCALNPTFLSQRRLCFFNLGSRIYFLLWEGNGDSGQDTFAGTGLNLPFATE